MKDIPLLYIAYTFVYSVFGIVCMIFFVDLFCGNKSSSPKKYTCCCKPDIYKTSDCIITVIKNRDTLNVS